MQRKERVTRASFANVPEHSKDKQMGTEISVGAEVVLEAAPSSVHPDSTMSTLDSKGTADTAERAVICLLLENKVNFSVDLFI